MTRIISHQEASEDVPVRQTVRAKLQPSLQNSSMGNVGVVPSPGMSPKSTGGSEVGNQIEHCLELPKWYSEGCLHCSLGESVERGSCSVIKAQGSSTENSIQPSLT
jgi:hypothetical protein